MGIVNLAIKPLPAKAGRFLLLMKVIYFKPQNRRTRNPGPDPWPRPGMARCGDGK